MSKFVKLIIIIMVLLTATVSASFISEIGPEIRNIVCTTGVLTQMIGGVFSCSNNIELGTLNATESIQSETYYLDGDHYIRLNGSDELFELVDSALWFQHNESMGAGSIAHLFTSGNKTMIWTQVGRNNSAGLLGNSWMIMPNSMAEAGFLGNMTKASDCLEVYDYYSKTVKIACDTGVYGASMIVQGGIDVWRQLFVGEGIQVIGSSVVNPQGSTFEVFNGTLIVFEERVEEVGVIANNANEISEADFEGGTLSPYVLGTSTGVNVWATSTDAQCHDTICAKAGSNVNTEMNVTISTFNTDTLNISFYATETNLDAADTFNVDFSNDSGASWYNVIDILDVQGASDSLVSNLSIPTGMDNQTSVTIRFTFVSNHATNEIAWIDDIVISGLYMETITQNVTRKDTKLQGAESNIFVYYNASNGEWQFSPNNVSFASSTVTTQNVTGNSEAENLWARNSSNTVNLMCIDSVCIDEWGDVNKTDINTHWLLNGTVLRNESGNLGVQMGLWDGLFAPITITQAYDSNASTVCAGATTYLNGENTCVDIDGVYLKTEVDGSITNELDNTNASSYCSGTTTYLDGEGNCDDISSVYLSNLVEDTTPQLGGDLDTNTFNISDLKRLGFSNGTTDVKVERWNGTCWVDEYIWGAVDAACPV